MQQLFDKKNLFSSKNFIIFINLLPAFLVTGPAIADIIVTISSIFFLIITFKKKLFKYYNNNFFKFFIAIWIYLIFCSLVSDYPFFSLKTSLTYIRFIIFSVFIYYLLDTRENFLNNFFLFLLVTISLVVFDGYIQFFFDYNSLGFPKPHVMERLSGFFNDEWILGSYLSRILPILLALYFFVQIKNKNLKIYFWTLVYLTIILVFLSGERASFLLSMITFFALIFFSKKKLLNLFMGIILILILAIVVNVNSKSKNRMIEQTINGFQFTTDGPIPKPKYLFTYGHTQHFMNAYRMFKDSPIIGHGPKNFRKKCNITKYSLNQFGCSTHPHNTYFQLLAETGIIGFAFFMLIFVYFSITIFFSQFKKIEKNNIPYFQYKLFLLISFICSLFPLVTTGNFFNNWLNVVYFLPVGFYLHATKLK